MIYEGDIPDAQWHKLNLTAAETLAPGHLSPPKGLDIGVLTDLGRLMHNIGSLNGDYDLVLWGTCLYVFPDVVESSRELYRKYRKYLHERRLMNSSWEDLSHIPEYSSP